MIDIALYLARQNGAFRGHTERYTSLNKGNFLELIQLLSKYESTIKMHLDQNNKIHSRQKTAHVSLLSNRTQTDIIIALATYVRGEILKEMDESKTFSILLDETTDVSHVEQASFLVRFVHQMQIKERFLQVCDVSGTTAKELEDVVTTVLEENGLKWKTSGSKLQRSRKH